VINIRLEKLKRGRIGLKTSNSALWIEKFEIQTCHAEIGATVQNERFRICGLQPIHLAHENLAIEICDRRAIEVRDIETGYAGMIAVPGQPSDRRANPLQMLAFCRKLCRLTPSRLGS